MKKKGNVVFIEMDKRLIKNNRVLNMDFLTILKEMLLNHRILGTK